MMDAPFLTTTFKRNPLSIWSFVYAEVPRRGKKKVYTKPKKNKHKHRKVPLAALKFYRIEGDKVVRLRMSCPNPDCGDGIYMASHPDRRYCGKCGKTIMYTKEEQEKYAREKAKEGTTNKPAAKEAAPAPVAAAKGGKGKKK